MSQGIIFLVLLSLWGLSGTNEEAHTHCSPNPCGGLFVLCRRVGRTPVRSNVRSCWNWSVAWRKTTRMEWWPTRWTWVKEMYFSSSCAPFGYEYWRFLYSSHHKVLNLLWNLAHSDDVPVDIMDQALSAHIKILDYSCSQVILSTSQEPGDCFPTRVEVLRTSQCF